jgi:hypothetical protein
MQMARLQKKSVLGFIAGIFGAAFGPRVAKPTPKDLKNADFPTSTQRMGVRFTDRIRDVFRFKWIKKP